jgi:hypothetical protein
MNKCSKINMSIIAVLATGLTVFSAAVIAHDDNEPGTPVCLEANYMMADAMNAPFAGPVTGPGRVIEMNIITGERGITVNNPFSADNAGTPICDNGGVTCAGPWKPTGVLSGGMNGHAFLTSAAQHAITEFHRDGTAVRTAPTLPTSPSPDGGGFGFVPRLLGTQIMPNGNLMQTVCDANFFNAANSDAVSPYGNTHASGNASNLFFPPVYSTAERAANSRILVLDQESLEVIDEYSAPDDPRWTCPAGISFTSEGMIVTGFHSAAAFIIDWKAGIDNEKSEGVGSNRKDNNMAFKLGHPENVAKIIRVVDLLNEDMDTDGVMDDAPAAMDDPNRRDSLRANSLDESGNLYGTFRARSLACEEGDADCNPGVFRQHVFIAAAGGNVKTGSIALDPGVNVIAGIRINRMSAIGCDFVTAEANAGAGATGDECDVETLYVAASAANAGCDADGDSVMGPGHPANQCFVPGGRVYEYRIDNAHIDGANGSCTGNSDDGYGAGQGNEGCAMPIAQFDVINPVTGAVDLVDPRMLMPIHEAFIQ